MSDTVRFEGTKMRIGSLDLVVPALSMGQAKRYDSLITRLSRMGGESRFNPDDIEAFVGEVSDRMLREAAYGVAAHHVESFVRSAAEAHLAKPPEVEDAMDRWVEIIHAAITRNYPDLSIEDLWDNLDLRNFQRVMQVIMAKTGYAPAGE